ncbi:MAG: hypothetical protein GY865_04680 [candidate division Zixibacteria bacterium]|nr:hypothetical protein [candidate division Zixibacteria bacterium]
MKRKLLILSIIFILVIAIAFNAISNDRQDELPTADLKFGQLQMEDSRAACQMYKFDISTTSISYYSGYVNGDGTLTYYDPTDPSNNGCGVAAAYPFEIQSVSFVLWDWGDGSVQWPVTLDIVIYDMAVPGDPCSGPGALLCSQTVTCDQATFDGTFGTVTLASPCCVNGPVFIGFHYNDAGPGAFPSVTFDASAAAPTPVQCDLWDYWGGSWKEWYTSWGSPPPNYPLFIVDGETESPNCDGGQTWTPGDPHKMHFPQLPDEAGWDVNATFPQILAADWQCSESGYIKDLHFWGSWLDGITGDIDHFIISFHEDIPAIDPVPFPTPLPWVPAQGDMMVITEGLPEGATIEIRPKFSDPTCDPEKCGLPPDPVCEAPGGSSGGTRYCDIEIVELSLTGTGPLAGFQRTLSADGEFEVELGPRDQGAANRSFPTEMISMSLSLFGDPDFDILEIRGGSGHSLPSPGQTTLTRLGPPGSDFAVDSFFDITYRIDFQGAPGSTLEGFSGSTTGTVRMEQKDDDEVSQGTVSSDGEFWSKPGLTIMEFDVYDFLATPITPATLEGWYDPATGDTQWDNHQEYFQYDMFFTDPSLWLWQDQGTIYWVNISAVLNDIGMPTQWGWKSTLDHWNDDAVWSQSPDLTWVEIWEPAVPIINNFTAQNNPSTGFTGTGDGAFEDMWFEYPSGWWNVWFYDHPLDLDRKKDFHVIVDVQPLDPTVPLDITFAINWSTDQWGDPTSPPLPGTDEDLYIHREIFPVDIGINDIVFEFTTYNPEWVSIDLLGTNYRIQGSIEHTCRGSLDLAFVVTGDPNSGDPEGACCYPNPDGTAGTLCTVTTQDDCVNVLGGVYAGDGTTCTADEACCLPDGSCTTLDPMCCELLGGHAQGPGTICTAPEACCLPDGSCTTLDPLCCVDLGGIPQGPGTSCSPAPEACCIPGADCQMLDPLCCEDMGGLPGGPGSTCTTPEACCMQDGSCQNLDPVCCALLGGTPQGTGTHCTAPEACCLPDGTCNDLDPECCDDLGGTPQGPGTACATTVCVEPDYKWQQLPDLTPTGFDVNASMTPIGPIVLADDYECTVTGPLTELKVWGSWLNDQFPSDATGIPDAGNASFTISMHHDIPAKDYVDFPIPCPWVPATGQVMVITEGLPDGATIEITPKFSDPTCDGDRCGHPPEPGKCESPGGSLGGTRYCDIEIVALSLVGTGSLSGFQRTLSANGEFEVELGPRDPSSSNRSFETDMAQMSVSLFGDPDFDNLEIRGGTGNGLPSPGHTTLTRLGPPGSDFQVDSFFDITYQIEFQGAVGGQLEGLMGTSQGTVRMEQKDADEVSDCTVSPYLIEHSRPGELICLWRFDPGSFNYSLYADNLEEGWYDPSGEFYDPNGDTQCWEYIFPLSDADPNCFYQEGTETNPVVYWIDVHAEPTDPDFYFGWKSSVTHWNDDAVWGIGQEPFTGTWNEMIYPQGHPYFGESVDLAFELHGDDFICDCEPGEVNGVPDINILDIVYLINYKYKGGPAPGPYELCSGDPNCDCNVDILDIVLLINYKYKNGPPPCSCEEWITACGGPLRK